MSAVKKLDLNHEESFLRQKMLEEIKSKVVSNPVLQRLRQTLSGKSGLVITSYDRMHHRHNRS